MFRIICVVIGYFIGCIQTAYIVGRLMGKVDIRNFGSGNAGTTNINRVLGAKAGLIVFVSDILKGMAGFIVCSLIFNGSSSFFSGNPQISLTAGLFGGIGVILGHNFPFYLKFKGGKGMAAAVGIIFCIDFRIALITFSCGILCVILTKYISLASLIVIILVPVLLWYFKYDNESISLACFIALMAYYQHRSNIVRLINGNENKFSVKKKEC